MAEIIKNDGRWLVSGDLCLTDIEALLVADTAVNGAGALEIDMSGVTEVDTVAISLLFEWMRQAERSDCRLVYVNLPANLTSLASLYGVLQLIPQTADRSAVH